MSDELFDDNWYAEQLVMAVERGEAWAEYYLAELIRSMRHQLNDTTLLKPEKSDGPGELS